MYDHCKQRSKFWLSVHQDNTKGTGQPKIQMQLLDDNHKSVAKSSPLYIKLVQTTKNLDGQPKL